MECVNVGYMPLRADGLLIGFLHLQVEEITEALGISHGSVSTILHDRLGIVTADNSTLRIAYRIISNL